MNLPMVVVESGPAAVEDARGELRSRGWSDVHELVVSDDEGAALAVLRALAGHPLLVDARAGREVLDDLCDDLRRLGVLDHRVGEPDALLTEEQHALLDLLAGGLSMGGAAQRLHLSRRSADRRLAAARVALGAATTGAAVVAYLRRLERLPAPP